MQNITKGLLAVTAVSSLFLTAGCIIEDRGPRRTVYVREPGPPVAEVVVTDAPPPVQTEVITISPGPEFIWLPGAWVWEGRWVWEHGRWDRPPRPGMRWMGHHYEVRGGRRVFIRGGWR